MINEYDEIKNLLKKSRMLFEQQGPVNLGKSIEYNIEDDTTEDSTKEIDPEKVKKEKSKTYRISGGLLTIHAKDKKDLELTTEEKKSFQETMDEFVNEVSDLGEFGVLNIYPNEVQWSGKILDFDIEFFFSIGEQNGVYIKGDMIRTDDQFLDFVNKLKKFYDQFKAKWSKVLATRKRMRKYE